MIEVVDEWQRFAACRGPYAEMFFPPSAPERKDEKALREMNAKAICEGCQVRDECLGYALEIKEPHGIWGGLNEIERRDVMERQFVRR
jgi:WhiB family redox-sensing transcriptional regulator